MGLGLTFSFTGWLWHVYTVVKGWYTESYLANKKAFVVYESNNLDLYQRAVRYLNTEWEINPKALDSATSLEHEWTIQARTLELDSQHAGSYHDPSIHLVVIVSNDIRREEELVSLAREHMRGDVEILFVHQEILGSGAAYLTARAEAKRNYERLKFKHAYMPSNFYQARIAYLLAGGQYADPLSIAIGMNHRPLSIPYKKRLLTTFEYQLLNAYKAAQNLNAESPERGAELLIPTDVIYRGPLLLKGKISLLSSLESRQQMQDQGLDMIDEPYQSEIYHLYEKPEADDLPAYVEENRRLVNFIHLDRQSLRQLPLWTGMMMISFGSFKKYRLFDEHMGLLAERAAEIYQRRGPHFKLDLAKDLIIPTLIEERRVENEEKRKRRKLSEERRAGNKMRGRKTKNLAAFFSVRTRDMDKTLKEEYALIFAVHSEEAEKRGIVNAYRISQSTPHYTQSNFDDIRNLRAFRRVIEGKGKYGILDRIGMKDPQGLMRYEPLSGNLFFNIDKEPPGLPNDIFLAHLKTGDFEATFAIGVDDEFRSNVLFGLPGTSLLPRFVARDGNTPLFSPDAQSVWDAPLAFLGPYRAEDWQWLHNLNQKKSRQIVLPVRNLMELKSKAVSMNWIRAKLTNTAGGVRDQRSELRLANPKISASDKDLPARLAAAADSIAELKGGGPNALWKANNEKLIVRFTKVLIENYRESVPSSRILNGSGSRRLFYVFEEDEDWKTFRQLFLSLPPEVKCDLIPATSLTKQARVRVYPRLRSLFPQEMAAGRLIIPDFKAAGWDTSEYIQNYRTHENLSRDEILNIDRAGSDADLLSKKYAEPVYVAATRIARIVVAAKAENFSAAPSFSLFELVRAEKQFQSSA